MVHTRSKTNQPSTWIQLLVNFILPLIILTRFSAESQLGPTKALLLALAFPVAFEIYSIKKRRKVSMLSVLAIGGILVTGAISLLGLSEGWLAVRRSVPYLAVAIAIIVSILIKRPLLKALLPQMLDMQRVTNLATERHKSLELEQAITKAGYILAALFVAITIVAYVLTRIVIISPTDTAEFNQEYARLRLWSLPAIMLPMFVGMAGMITYLFKRLEKITGLDFEEILKKK
jgi:intracellular septation protein A